MADIKEVRAPAPVQEVEVNLYQSELRLPLVDAKNIVEKYIEQGIRVKFIAGGYSADVARGVYVLAQSPGNKLAAIQLLRFQAAYAYLEGFTVYPDDY